VTVDGVVEVAEGSAAARAERARTRTATHDRDHARLLPADRSSPHLYRSGRDGGDWVSEVIDLPGGPLLLAELLETGYETLNDVELVTALALWERVVAWVTARHHDALATLAVRESRFGGPRQVAAVLASELRCTQQAAESKLALARSLALFPVVQDALETGSLDLRKAQTILTEAQGAPEGSAQHVAALGVALAPSRTPPQLRRALAAAVMGLDPGAAAKRARRAESERRVEFLPLPDSMALISAYLPAADALAVKTALDALARTGGSEDPRSFDQRRADALSAIFWAVCEAGEAPLHPEHLGAGGEGSPGTGAGRDPDAEGAISAGADGRGLDGRGADAGGADGRGADAATAKRASTDAEPGAISDGAGPGPAPLWRRLATRGRHRAHLHVTVSGTTLLGLDDEPGDLAGYGPIPADVAREIARDATWRAVLTDARLGTVTAVGENSYRPGAVLSRDVMARDRTCTFPGCSQPAYRCDLDHRRPFDATLPAHDQTHKDNLHALCRFHHNLKTLHGWVPRFDPHTGVTSWRSPLGSVHERRPEPPLPPWEEWLTQIDAVHRRPSSCPYARSSPSPSDAAGPDAAGPPPLPSELDESPTSASDPPSLPPPF